MLTLSLRAAMGLANVLSSRGERDEARETVSGVLGRFTEGSATADLIDAKNRLDELAEPLA